ncbi:synaptic vesicle glycoprotein 2B-like [Fopius arisanus]|uniref:Synaptic vesicle glycoprotein 2B-like n=1 Tax=Fopius arisanus TaxID=64838 RepID=A0A9R1U5N1_9HYME|nr:PREDICTED: synaptic vesicle glycoprotein 2B-like [Fopius arisanus]
MVVGDVQNGLSIIQLSDYDIENELENKAEKTRASSVELEDALIATGFGFYNIFIALAAIPVAWASAFDMTTMAFILASAECELELTLIRKGLLVSSVYFGMMVTSFFWSFITERLHRKTMMMVGLFIDALCNIACCFVESYYVILLLKFITGTIVSGPLTLLIPYINEFQPSNFRQKFNMWSGLIFNIGFIAPAILAFNITPQSWSFVILNREYTAWRIYLMACTLPSIIGCITMTFSPESPQQLMKAGDVDRTYCLLRRMYVINNLKSPETFTVKRIHSHGVRNRVVPQTNVKTIRRTWSDIKQLCNKKYLKNFLMINFLQFGSLLGFNVMRLWVPHMFMIINNFQSTIWDWTRGDPTMCDYLSAVVIPEGVTNNTLYANNCAMWRINPIIYVRSTIIAFSTVGFAFLFALFHTTKVKRKIAMVFCYTIAAVSSFVANWVQLVPVMLVLSSIIIVTGRITGNIVIGINTAVIPLSLRTTAISFITNTGNVATIFGNLIFSWLLSFHCYSAFVGIGFILLLCLLMSFHEMTPPEEDLDSKT